MTRSQNFGEWKKIKCYTSMNLPSSKLLECNRACIQSDANCSWLINHCHDCILFVQDWWRDVCLVSLHMEVVHMYHFSNVFVLFIPIHHQLRLIGLWMGRITWRLLLMPLTVPKRRSSLLIGSKRAFYWCCSLWRYINLYNIIMFIFIAVGFFSSCLSLLSS